MSGCIPLYCLAVLQCNGWQHSTVTSIKAAVEGGRGGYAEEKLAELRSFLRALERKAQ